jgi:hypothetical protein
LLYDRRVIFDLAGLFFWILCHADSHLKYINQANSLHGSKVAVIKKGKATQPPSFSCRFSALRKSGQLEAVIYTAGF